MVAAPIEIGGLPIPDDRPLFLAVLAVHVLAASACVLAGAAAALARKSPGRHPAAGRVYHRALLVAVASLAVLALLRWPHDTHLLIIGLVGLAAATVGVRARRQRWRRGPGWPIVHGTAMTVSYAALLTGFYVDNGPNLPLWRELPHASYWILPTLIAIPLLLRALRRLGTGRALGAGPAGGSG